MHDGTLDKPIEWEIPGMKNIRFKDLPSFMRTQSSDDIMFNFLFSGAQNCSKSPTIIFNSFRDFEADALLAIAAKHPSSRVYAIGPLGLLGPKIVPPESPVHSLSSTLWKEDSKCLQWLDGREPGSVVYVNYGSITTMTPQNFAEFAWGLAGSGQDFLWIVRPDVVEGSDATAALPEGFLEAVGGRGLLATWCPQEQVLAHPAVGAFLTHCGWNSTLDTVCAGVPVMCWPFFADQQTNCRYACVNWGMGAEVGGEVERGEVAGLVKEMMEGEKGRVWREKALDWKRKAVEATNIGGSSRTDFDKLIEEGFNF